MRVGEGGGGGGRGGGVLGGGVVRGGWGWGSSGGGLVWGLAVEWGGDLWFGRRGRVGGGGRGITGRLGLELSVGVGEDYWETWT